MAGQRLSSLLSCIYGINKSSVAVLNDGGYLVAVKLSRTGNAGQFLDFLLQGIDIDYGQTRLEGRANKVFPSGIDADAPFRHYGIDCLARSRYRCYPFLYRGNSSPEGRCDHY